MIYDGKQYTVQTGNIAGSQHTYSFTRHTGTQTIQSKYICVVHKSQLRGISTSGRWHLTLSLVFLLVTHSRTL